MPRIHPIDPDAAEGAVKATVDGYRAKLGFVPNMVATMGRAPAVLAGYAGLAGAFSGGALGAQLGERLALVVAETNGCGYCLSAHTAIGKAVGVPDAELVSSRTASTGDSRIDAALAFARAVVQARGHVSDADLAAVRAAGWTDGDALEIVGHVALNVFTNYVNSTAGTEIDFPVAQPLAA